MNSLKNTVYTKQFGYTGINQILICDIIIVLYLDKIGTFKIALLINTSGITKQNEWWQGLRKGRFS